MCDFIIRDRIWVFGTFTAVSYLPFGVCCPCVCVCVCVCAKLVEETTCCYYILHKWKKLHVATIYCTSGRSYMLLIHTVVGVEEATHYWYSSVY